MMHRREAKIFEEIRPHLGAVSLACKQHGIAPALALAILFVERQQYQLHNAVCALKAAKERLCRVSSFNRVIGQFMTCSVGFAHIKASAAHRARLIFPEIDPADIETMHQSAPASIRVMCGVLRAHAADWYGAFPEITNRPDILATIYNIGWHRRPHPAPRVGGSRLPLYIDGRLIEGESFGRRVELVMQSQAIRGVLASLEK